MNSLLAKTPNGNASDYGGSGLFSHTITNSRVFGTQQQPSFVPVETPGPSLLLAVRIMDGLFVGNSIAAQDDEFLFSNKVSHIVNCAGLEAANIFAEHGVEYLTFPWRDVPTTVLLDSRDRNITRVSNFIDQAFEKGECVLVQSLHGNSRSCVIIAAYFIYKYGWSLESTLAFMQVAHPDMRIKNYFLRQLKDFARKNNATRDIFSTELPCNTEEEIHQMLLKNTYLNSLPLTEPLPPPPKKNARKKLTISLREEPPGSRHLVSTIDPKTKEKVPIKGILRVKVVLQHQLSSQFSVQASQTVAVPTTKNEVLPSTEIISPPSQPQTVENKETKPQQEVPRIMDSKPRSLSLIDPETNSLDDSLDNDGLQILTQVEPKSLTANNSLFTPVTKTANTTPSTSATTTTLQSATLDSKATSFKDTISDTISELSSVSSMDEEELKKKRKKKPSSQPTNTSTVAASQSNRKRPNSFSSTSAGAKPQSNTPVIHAPMKFRKPTPPKRNEPTEEESNNVTVYSNYSHRASKTVEESLSSNNYAYTGSLATDTPLFIKAARDKRSMSPGVTKTTPTISRPNSSTLLQPTISSTLKNDPLGTKKRPSSAPKSRPKEEDQENTIFTNMAERSALRSSFTAPNSLSKPVLTSTDLSSSLPKRLNSTTSRNDSSGSGGNRLLRPTLSFLSKTVKKT